MPKPEPVHIDLRWTSIQSLSPDAYDHLNDDERAMVARLPETARAAYVAAHSLLRVTLSEWEPRPPRSWRFIHSEHGKPYLADSKLRFNLSHSAYHAVVAVSDAAEIGVDVEEVVSHRVDAQIAQRMFAADEYQHWLHSEDQIDAFFRIWTLKEAYMKATGLGVALPLHDFSIRLAPPQLIHKKVRSSDWHLLSQVIDSTTMIGLVAKPDAGRTVKTTLRQISA